MSIAIQSRKKGPERQVVEQIAAQATSDGDGVKLLRVFGGSQPERFDPFLLMDEFGSEQASDYIGGFPPHPHRGFETVTYMLQGKMEHRDHMGNVGLLNDSDVQWMTAGRGVIHSEMPRQTEGKMRGFQFWVNLPAARKMTPAVYRDVSGGAIPVFTLPGGILVKAIAGAAQVNSEDVKGYFEVVDTEAVLLDIHLPEGQTATVDVGEDYNSLAYVYDGQALLGEQRIKTNAQIITRFGGSGSIEISNNQSQVTRVMLMAGKPLGESIVQHGPFVMNSADEIEQAIRDYQMGELTG